MGADCGESVFEFEAADPELDTLDAIMSSLPVHIHQSDIDKASICTSKLNRLAHCALIPHTSHRELHVQRQSDALFICMFPHGLCPTDRF